MIRHQLITEQFDLVALQAFMPNLFKREKVAFFAKNLRSEVPTMQGVIQASWNWPYNRKEMEVYCEKGAVFSLDAASMREVAAI